MSSNWLAKSRILFFYLLACLSQNRKHTPTALTRLSPLLSDASCVAYTFDTVSSECFLKDNVQGNTTQSGRTSESLRPPSDRVTQQPALGPHPLPPSIPS